MPTAVGLGLRRSHTNSINCNKMSTHSILAHFVMHASDHSLSTLSISIPFTRHSISIVNYGRFDFSQNVSASQISVRGISIYTSTRLYLFGRVGGEGKVKSTRFQSIRPFNSLCSLWFIKYTNLEIRQRAQNNMIAATVCRTTHSRHI